jgi:hypothetical protein
MEFAAASLRSPGGASDRSREEDWIEWFPEAPARVIRRLLRSACKLGCKVGEGRLPGHPQNSIWRCAGPNHP